MCFPKSKPRSSLSFNLVIERLLISGGDTVVLEISSDERFNLVIERLLISGMRRNELSADDTEFQSRYRAASHFRIT